MNDKVRTPSTDIAARWYKFTSDCNADAAYAHSGRAATHRGVLEDAWRRECPALQVPSVVLSPASGKYELKGLNVYK